MSRRRRRNRTAERDHNSIANLRLPPRINSSSSRLLLSPFSDRRMFHPDDVFAPVFSTRKDQRRIVDRNVNVGRSGSTPYRNPFAATRLGFNVPAKVSVCVRRSQRKEVLFALRRTGKGSRSPKRRNYWSDVQC